MTKSCLRIYLAPWLCSVNLLLTFLIAVSPRFLCHSDCCVTQFAVSPRFLYHSDSCVTQFAVSLGFRCHSDSGVTQIPVSLRFLLTSLSIKANYYTLCTLGCMRSAVSDYKTNPPPGLCRLWPAYYCTWRRRMCSGWHVLSLRTCSLHPTSLTHYWGCRQTREFLYSL